MADYKRAVAAYQAGLQHECDADERAIMESNLALAARGLDRLESLGLVTKLFGRSPHGDSIEWTGPTRDHRFSPPTDQPFPIVPGSAAAPVSLAPGCGVWIHARPAAVLGVLSDTSPPPPPGRSTPVAILDLSNGTIPSSACSTIATSFGLGDANVIRVHEVGNAAAAASLNRCDWTMVARSIPRSNQALQLLWNDADEHVLVGADLGAHDIIATPVSYAHIIGNISSASIFPKERDEMLLRLVASDTRFWATSPCVDRPLVAAARLVGVQVTAIDPA